MDDKPKLPPAQPKPPGWFLGEALRQAIEASGGALFGIDERGKLYIRKIGGQWLH